MDIIHFKTLLGYEKTLTPALAARAADTLAKCLRYTVEDEAGNDIKTIMTEAEFIVFAILSGRDIKEQKEKPCNRCKEYCNAAILSACTKGKTSYHLWGKKHGTGITKTGYGFAKWLMEQGLTTDESVRERIASEFAAKEKAEHNASMEAERKREADRIAFEACRKHDQWFAEAVRNYGGAGTPEGEKVLIQREIFIDMLGHYNEKAIELLVMIDNIDNPACRAGIISHLHNNNVASIKTFEHITGIKLARSQKERRAQLEIITKADYAPTPKQYKPRAKPGEADYDKPFYKCLYTEGFAESRGRLWRYKDHDFYITVHDGSYSATEGRSGLGVTNKTKSFTDVTNAIKAVIERMGESFDNAIKQAVGKYGLSPLYAETGE